MNPKGYKYQVQIHIEKVEIHSHLSCQLQVLLKCGNQKVQTQQLADYNLGKAIINETLAIQTNVYQINGIYQEKKMELIILLITPKGNKKGGQCNIDIAELLNQYKYDIVQDNLLENCPDSKAKIQTKIHLTEVGEVDFDQINTHEQISDKKPGILTPFKAALESTAKKYFGDNQSVQSPNLEKSISRSQIKHPSVTDVSSQFASPKQNSSTVNQIQQDLQNLHEELNQQKILYMELKEQSNKYQQELQTEKVKKEALILQLQEQRKQIEKMIDQNIYQGQIQQYEEQISQIQSQLRQAQKDNENLTQNYKKAMQKYNKLSEEYNQYQKSINLEDKTKSSINQQFKELQEICYKKDQLYSILERSNNESQLRNINFENQIIQQNQQLLLLQNKLDEKDILINSQKETLNSLNIQLLNVQNQISCYQQNEKIHNEKIIELSKKIIDQQQNLEIKKQYEDQLYSMNQNIQKLSYELNNKQNQLIQYQTLSEQQQQQYKLEMDELIKKIQISKQQQQTELNQEYREKEQIFKEELQQQKEQINQLQQLINDSITQVQIMKTLFLDPQNENVEIDLPNQLAQLNKIITLKFCKLQQDLEQNSKQIQDQEKEDCQNYQNQQSIIIDQLQLQALELNQAKQKIDNLQSENEDLKQQIQLNLNQQIIQNNEKIQNLEIENKDIIQQSISYQQINQQLIEQINIFDQQNQDLQIKLQAQQIEILKKEDQINNLSSKISQLNQLNQEQIIINEQLQYQIKEQINNAQQLEQDSQISKTQQDLQNNDLIVQNATLLNKIAQLNDQNIILEEQINIFNNQLKELEIINQQYQEQILSLKQIENNQEKCINLEQQIEELTIELNQKTNELLQIQNDIEQMKNENNSLNQTQEILLLKETEMKLQIDQLQVINEQSNQKIEELKTQIKENQIQYQYDIQELQQQLFSENDEWLKEKETIQQYIDELEQKGLELANQIKEKNSEIQYIQQQNQRLNDQLESMKQCNERLQQFEKQCLENKQKYEQQIDEINLKNILKNNDFIKQIQQLQQQSQNDQVKVLELKKQLEEKEVDIKEKEDKHNIEIQLITNNYVNRLKDKDDVIQHLQQEIQSYQQSELEQQNLIKFLENVKENLEQQKCENFEYIQNIQLTNEKIICQKEQIESQVNQLQLTIKELEQKNHELETEKINISNNYQQALIEAQSLNQTQENSNEIMEKIQEEVVILKCRIGDMFNAALEFGGPKLVDQLQQALGIKE